MRDRLRRFHRKFWIWVLEQAKKRLTVYDMVVVLDEIWWELVKYRMSELGGTDDGIAVAEVIFLNNEGEAIDTNIRDVRDTDRDMRGDRAVT